MWFEQGTWLALTLLLFPRVFLLKEVAGFARPDGLAWPKSNARQDTDEGNPEVSGDGSTRENACSATAQAKGGR